ncbi:MAG: phosphate/phosphite/phosphonate ABC transporter substrate-binding protein, partial [Campylobacterales bacterium]|nr:phosphate/phosphite/phosphonate ABC transporter substrate-binding protein [Campylobacterales bacterium]
ILEKEQMKGKNFLFPAPFAFAATLLTKYELKKKYGFDIEKEGKVLYVNSHDSVYKGVARGIGTYGGGIVRTYNKLKDEKTQGNIGILYKTEKYPSHPIGVKSSISKKDREKLRSALLKMPSEILKKLTNKDLKKIDSSEYDVIKSLARELGIY